MCKNRMNLEVIGMAYPIEKGQRQSEATVPIQTSRTGSGCIPDMESQYLNESMLRIGDLRQYVENYMTEGCRPPRECEAISD